MKGAWLFGGCFIIALGSIGLSLQQPYTQPAPKGVVLTPLSDVKRGDTRQAKADVCEVDGKTVRIDAIVDWRTMRGIDGKGNPIDQKTISQYKAATTHDLNSVGVYFSLEGFTEPPLTVHKIGGFAVHQTGCGVDSGYGLTEGKVDLSRPIKVVVVLADDADRQPVAIISCQVEGESQGFHWRMYGPHSRWQVLQSKTFLAGLDVEPPSELAQVSLGFLTEQDEREFPNHVRFNKWTEFDAGIFSDDLENGVYGTIWSCPRWVLEFEGIPQKHAP